MAVKGKAAKQPIRAGLGFDEMAQGGLPDDFDGTVVKAVFAPTNYDGKLDHYTLAALITLKPDDDSGHDEFTQIYSVGDLQFFAPSKDGEEPVDMEGEEEGEALEGAYLVPVGDRKQLSNSSNFAFFVRHLEAAGFTGLAETASLDSLVGLYGHWNQIELPKRSGIVAQADSGRKGPRTLLCVTEIKDAPKATAKGKAAAPKATAKANTKSKAAEAEEDDEGETLESRVGDAIVDALSEADDNSLPKSKLIQIVVKAFPDTKEKAAAVKIVSSPEFLGSGEYGFSYDKKSATISLG